MSDSQPSQRVGRAFHESSLVPSEVLCGERKADKSGAPPGELGGVPGAAPQGPQAPRLSQGPESRRTPQDWRSGLRGISSPVPHSSRAWHRALHPKLPLLPSPHTETGTQRFPGVLRLRPGVTSRASFAGQPRGARGRPFAGSDAERREGHAHRGLSSLSTSASGRTPAFPLTARQVSMTAPKKRAEGRKQA